MHHYFGLLLLGVTTQLICIDGFIPPSASLVPKQNRQLYSSIYPSGGGGNTDNNGDGNSKDEEFVTSCHTFEMFLTQCTIQSFMFLLAQTRDPHTIRWLDAFTQPNLIESIQEQMEDIDFAAAATFSTTDATTSPRPSPSSRLLRYHGLGAMDTELFPSWDIYFAKLLEQPEAIIVVEPRPGQEIEIDINPASLCARMISVREQISRELANDLEIISQMGGQIFYSYWEKVKEKKEKQEQEGAGDDDGSNLAFDRQNLVFLEYDPNDIDIDMRPSPLRKGNFDLLLLLSLQEAIESVLQCPMGIEGDNSVRGSASLEFLRAFYTERLDSHFKGTQRYGRADDFIEELLLSPPRIDNDAESTTGEPSIVNPLRIAEIVLIERDHIASAWSKIALLGPEKHMGIRRLMLDRLMGRVETADKSDDFQ